MANRKNKWVINSLLLILGFATSFSGVVIQVGYHFGSPDAITKAYRLMLGVGYESWATVHKIVSILFLLLCIYHIYIHRKWYGAVLSKQVLRNKNRAVLIFSLLFFLSVITGLIPWCICIFDLALPLRFQLIEIHDKLAILFIIFTALHIQKRRGRLA